MKYEKDLEERVFRFAVDTIKFINTIPYKKEYDVFRYQLSKSATSIGANYQESQAGSFAEFKQRIQICLREAKETHYWYRIINQLEIGDRNLCSILLQESTEIMLILGSISSKTKNKIKD